MKPYLIQECITLHESFVALSVAPSGFAVFIRGSNEAERVFHFGAHSVFDCSAPAGGTRLYLVENDVSNDWGYRKIKVTIEIIRSGREYSASSSSQA